MLSKPDINKITELVISGGGTNYIAMLGALDVCYKYSILDEIKTYVGTSIGAILCFLLSISYHPQQIFRISLEYEFSQLNDVRADDLLSFFDNLGLSKGERILDILRIFMKHRKIPIDVTFDQLFKITQKKISIVSWCVNDQKSICFHYQNSPQMSVLTALHMSISVPFLFRPVLYQHKFYVDGAVNDNFPICFSEDKENTFYLGLKHIVPEPINNGLPVLDFLTYVQKLYNSVFTHITQLKIEAYPSIRFLLLLNIPTSSVLNYEITNNQKQLLFQIGYMQCEEYLNQQFMTQQNPHSQPCNELQQEES